MFYSASYIEDKSIKKRVFNTLEEIEKFNKLNNVSNHNLHRFYNLDEVVDDGLIVCIEGDDTLYEYDLQIELEKFSNFLMLNNIYKEPNKLMTLKDKKVDVLVIQSTGIRKKEIKQLQEYYINEIGTYPKAIVCVFGTEDDILEDLIYAAPFNISIYNFRDIKNNKIILTEWVGVSKQRELLKNANNSKTTKK